MSFVDRILTIVVTATLTSAVWIIAGGSLIENASSLSQRDVTRPAEAAPSPPPSAEVFAESGAETGTVSGAETDVPAAESTVAAPLAQEAVQSPTLQEVRTLRIPVLNIRASDLSDTYRASGEEGGLLHEAIDISAPVGTSVVAAAPGTIERLYRSQIGGNTIYVRSNDRETIHYYAHLDAYAEGLKEGQLVRRGQRLGKVGTTGNADAQRPHLHFAILRTTADAEWWEPANAVNPYSLLMGQN